MEFNQINNLFFLIIFPILNLEFFMILIANKYSFKIFLIIFPEIYLS
jgi:hypothetical protein